MLKYEDAVATIVEYLRTEFRIGPEIPILPTTSVSLDLGIDSDDLTFLLTKDLERKFGKKLAVSVWSSIQTVEEIAKAFTEKDKEEGSLNCSPNEQTGDLPLYRKLLGLLRASHSHVSPYPAAPK